MAGGVAAGFGTGFCIAPLVSPLTPPIFLGNVCDLFMTPKFPGRRPVSFLPEAERFNELIIRIQKIFLGG
jgi:hypothetical protein